MVPSMTMLVAATYALIGWLLKTAGDLRSSRSEEIKWLGLSLLGASLVLVLMSRAGYQT